MSQHSRPFVDLHKVRGPGTKLQQGQDKGREATALPAQCADANKAGRQGPLCGQLWVGAKGLVRPGSAGPGNTAHSIVQTAWLSRRGELCRARPRNAQSEWTVRVGVEQAGVRRGKVTGCRASKASRRATAPPAPAPGPDPGQGQGRKAGPVFWTRALPAPTKRPLVPAAQRTGVRDPEVSRGPLRGPPMQAWLSRRVSLSARPAPAYPKRQESVVAGRFRVWCSGFRV